MWTIRTSPFVTGALAVQIQPVPITDRPHSDVSLLTLDIPFVQTLGGLHNDVRDPFVVYFEYGPRHLHMDAPTGIYNASLTGHRPYAILGLYTRGAGHEQHT